MSTSHIDEYIELVSERPYLFEPDGSLKIITNKDEIEKFAAETEKQVGIVYKSPFNMMVVDVVEAVNGSRFAYERIIQTECGDAVVIVAMLDGELVMLKQFRHAIRETQRCFPRGFADQGLSAEDNAAKELAEEVGGTVKECYEIGEIAADSGLTSTKAKVVVCTIRRVRNMHTEGIEKISLVSPEQLGEMIAEGKINDGFTLSAYAICKAHGVF